MEENTKVKELVADSNVAFVLNDPPKMVHRSTVNSRSLVFPLELYYSTRNQFRKAERFGNCIL